MADVELTQGDTFPSIYATLSKTVDGAVSPVDLTGCIVTLRMVSTVAVATGPVVIVSATAGTVRYDWQTTDTATAGEYKAEWVVTTGSGKVFTVPNKGQFTISVELKL